MKLRTVMMFVLALGVSSLAQAAGEIVIKFSHVVAPDTPKGRAAEKFKQLAEQMTKGKVKVEIYPNSQLYKDREEIEALQSGAVQMLAPSMAKFGPMGAREFELFDLPYLFPNQEVLHRVMDGDVGKKLFAKLDTKGVTGLAFWDNGFKQMSSNQADAQRVGFFRFEDAHPVFQGADRTNEGAGCKSASDGVQRGVHRIAARRGGWHGKSGIQFLHPEDERGAKST